MPRARQPRYSLDHQLVAADPLDPRAHRHETGCQVADLGLARGVGEHGPAVGQGRRHQQVLGGTHRDEREHDRSPAQPPTHLRVDVPAIKSNLGPHLLQGLEVQIDRPGADRAAARERDPRLAHARQQRPQHQDRGAHFANDIVGRLGASDGAPERKRAAIAAHRLHRDPVLREQCRHGVNVGELRHVLQDQPLLGKQPGHHQRQRRVLRAADDDLALKRPAAANTDAVHRR